jgi:hypothetical protein
MRSSPLRGRLSLVCPTSRWGWLLLLALLLPLAQTLAAAHSLIEHSAPSQTSEPGKKALLEAPCSVCVSAAGIGAGALPCADTPFAAVFATHAVPATRPTARTLAAGTLAYRSRAPPIALL